MKRSALLAAAACMAAAGGGRPEAAAAAQAADLVVTQGAIYTVEPANTWVEALAVKDGRYVFVGSAADARAWVGPETKVVDLGGRMAMPGLNDLHVHPLMGAIKALYECTFPFTAKPEDVASALAACAKQRPKGSWITGGQWGSSFFEQHELSSPREFLDRVTSDHPVFFNDDSGHNGWVNSAALKLAGIDASTPNPEGGTIVRGPDGAPNGVLLETAARLFDKVIPDRTDAEYGAAAKEAARIANAYGITGIKDAGAFHPAPRAFHLLDTQGDLTLHVAACLRTPYGPHSAPLDYEALEAERRQYRSRHVNTDFVKLFLDGVPTPARTAAMIAPYVPDRQHGRKFTGGLHIDPALLAAHLVELDRRGFTVKMHAAGDRAVRAGLDAIEQARKVNGRSGLRHELAHAGFIHPKDLPRFAQLDAVADFAPILWHPSPIIAAVIAAVGEKRGSQYWPTRSLLDSGAFIVSGSDWPAAVPDQNPWVGIEALVTRRDPRGETAGMLWKEEAATLEEAVRIYTLNGAVGLKAGDRTGSIAVGKSADFIVLDRNIFRVPIEDVGDTQVQQTWFEGRLVHEQG